MHISAVDSNMDEMEQVTSHVTAHCRTDPIIESFNYTWTISNFWSLFRNVFTLTSDKIEELPFTIELKTDEDKKKIYFHLSTDASLFSCALYLEDVPNGRKYRISTRHHTNQLCYALDIMFFEKHISVLWNNALRVICQFFLIKTVMHKSICNVITEPEDMLPINIKCSVDNESDSKVTLTAFEERFSIHKDLLSSRSTVFKAMFDNNPTVDVFQLVAIDNVTRPTLYLFISFLQTGHIIANAENMTKFTLYQLFGLANDYDIQDLKTLCRHYIIKDLTHETAVESLTLAHLYNDENLRKFVINYIKLHMKDMRNNFQFVLTLQEYPELLAKFMMSDDLPTKCCEFSTSYTAD
ncbi:uncharacterized protein LOC116846853 [Odontomachus brunneus]|uniref:uncharacterized protein LOC116846853 n=1 Tax=Odontomachus brunneus TaxID=486640 RepID=UPI0013F19DB8|nr:uncharacterized protein LOC116846853 [Odontomachus brunneus]XP_032677108.1 uncharacterized protein LOC116846853 [Odontomachus brunneus]XP_032677119.1 uncharacterized protein LOC116846853 [Odontomachus brunneus]